MLLKELGFDLQSFQPIGNVTYSPCSSLVPDIVNNHCDQLKNLFNISCPKDDTKLPKVFWVPKLHKDPYKFRFIAGARKCTTKCLSVILNPRRGGVGAVDCPPKVFLRDDYKTAARCAAIFSVPLPSFFAHVLCKFWLSSLYGKVTSSGQAIQTQKKYSPSQTFSADKVDKVILLTFGDLKIDPEVEIIDVF